MFVHRDTEAKKPGSQKRRYAWIIITFIGLIIAGGQALYWQFPNFYSHPAAQLYSWTARLSALLGNGEIAYFNANRAAILDPTNIEYLSKRCWYGSLAGDVAQVIGDCQRVVDAWPSSISAHCGLGVALVFLGDFAGAVKEFQFYIDNADQGHHNDSFTQEHRQWTALMENGSPPFNDQTMRKLLIH